MAVEPTDIGLATYNDVGDVSQLRTVAKTVVAAINELKQGADIDPIIGDQVYIDGENNVVIGKGNVVKGKNNLVFGSDNIVVGDNVVLFNNKRDVLEAHDFNCCAVNFETHHIICQNPEGLVERNIGDKLVLCIYQNWFNQETEESVIRDLPLQICTITEIVDAMEFVVDDIETDHTPPDEVHTTLDYELGKRCYPLNNSIKYSCSENAFILGGLAHGKGSLSTNDSESNGQYSFSANQGKANGYNGIAVNRAKCEGEDSFAANTANVYGSGSAKVLSEHAKLFIDLSEVASTTTVIKDKSEPVSSENKLSKSIGELDLTVRSYNCLKRAGINTLEELCNKSRTELENVRNLGKKSLKEIFEKLVELGLSPKIDEKDISSDEENQ